MNKIQQIMYLIILYITFGLIFYFSLFAGKAGIGGLISLFLVIVLLVFGAVCISSEYKTAKKNISDGSLESRTTARENMLQIKTAIVPLIILCMLFWALVIVAPHGRVSIVFIPAAIAIIFSAVAVSGMCGASAVLQYSSAGLAKDLNTSKHMALQFLIVADVIDAVYLSRMMREEGEVIYQKKAEARAMAIGVLIAAASAAAIIAGIIMY